MCGDSLISTVNGEVLIPDPVTNKDAIQLQLKVTPIQQAIQPLLELQQQYFDAQTDERSQLRKQILEAETNIFRVAIAERLSFWESEQEKLNRTISKKGKLTKNTEKKKNTIEAQISELDKLLIDVENRKRSLSFFQYYLHFRDVFEVKGGFDIVIGNPPYVRQEQIKELKPALKEEYECYTGVADLYVYFFEKGYRLLKSGGALTYISSNKYFRSGYGEKLRKYLGEQATVQHLIDFGDASIFDATVDTCIALITKTQPKNNQTSILNWNTKQSVDEISSVFKTQKFSMAQKQLTSDGWRLESPEVLRLLDKLRDAGTPLGEYVNGRFYYGIKTGLNKAFVLNKEIRDKLIAEHSSSAEVLKPFLRGRDVKRWSISNSDLWLLFIPWHFPLNNDSSIQGASAKAEKEFEKYYPAIYNYLLQFKTKLSARNKAETGIRYEWYALQRCAATYWQELELPKIVYPDIAQQCQFAVDQNGLFPDCTTFFIPNPSLYLSGILNSKINQFLFPHICQKLGNEGMRFKSIYVSQIPIPSVSKADRITISNLVKKCLDVKGQNVKDWEAEINDRVAHLYGLTAQEIKLINS